MMSVTNDDQSNADRHFDTQKIAGNGTLKRMTNLGSHHVHRIQPELFSAGGQYTNIQPPPVPGGQLPEDSCGLPLLHSPQKSSIGSGEFWNWNDL